MTTRALRGGPLWNAIPGPSRLPARGIHHTIPRPSAVTASSTDHFTDFRFQDLCDNLRSATPIPNRIWAYYTALLTDVGASTVPPELHHDVLRKCTPSFRVNRKPIGVGSAYVPIPHVHEKRFRMVIHNIRLSGGRVSLDEFHFIIHQFAAVGYVAGAFQVLRELAEHGIQPTAKTYALVLQTIAHRLRLPFEGDEAAMRAREVQKCVGILSTMSERGIPLSPACLDLSVRILRETADEAGFNLLLKTAYGIELSPRPQTSTFGLPSLKPSSATTVTSELSEHTPQTMPLSTHALNTVVETFGRQGRISQLVHAFEVLTNPLPPPPSEEALLADDEEDDTDFGLPWNNPQPSVDPNIETYNTLIKWTAEANNTALARHYVTVAVEEDRLASRRLLSDIHNNLPLEDIRPPKIGINRRTLMPVYGMAHKNKDIVMFRWLLKICNRIVRRKTTQLGLHYDWVAKLVEQGLHDPLPAILTNVEDARHIKSYASSSAPAEVQPPAEPEVARPKSDPILDIDLDKPHPPPAAHQPFKPATHIALLQRSLFDIHTLSSKLATVLGRLVQRKKERLGRRVWKGQDIYLRSEGRRGMLSKEEWTDGVKFQPQDYAKKELWRDIWSEEMVRKERRARPQWMRRRKQKEEAGIVTTPGWTGPKSSTES